MIRHFWNPIRNIISDLLNETYLCYYEEDSIVHSRLILPSRRCDCGRKLFAVVRYERKFNRRTKLRRWNSATVWGLVFKVAVDFHRRQLYGRGALWRFRFLQKSHPIYLNLNKFPRKVFAAFHLGLALFLPSSLIQPLPSTLSAAAVS